MHKSSLQKIDDMLSSENYETNQKPSTTISQIDQSLQKETQEKIKLHLKKNEKIKLRVKNKDSQQAAKILPSARFSTPFKGYG